LCQLGYSIDIRGTGILPVIDNALEASTSPAKAPIPRDLGYIGYLSHELRQMQKMKINNSWIKIGSLVAALAVVLGGFDFQEIASQYTGRGLSGSKTPLPDCAVDIPRAILFQLVHGLAIVLVGVLMVLRPGRLLRMSGQCFLLGTVMFSGSIYAVSLTGIAWLEHFKLLGVLLLVAGWILLVEGGCPGWNAKDDEPSDDAA